MKILMVEDSKELTEELSKCINTIEGAEIIGTAHSEDEAIKMYFSKRPEIITLDIRLKEGSGLNVLAMVKKETSPPIVLMLTNYPFPQYREKCMKLGADFFFDKSEDIQVFIHKLKELKQYSAKKMEESK